MAPGTQQTDNRGKENCNKNCICRVCNKKVVNGLTCVQCGDLIHYRCAQAHEDKYTNGENWKCVVCSKSNAFDITLGESELTDDSVNNAEINYLKRENNLLRKLLKEMEDKNNLLQEKINYLTDGKPAAEVIDLTNNERAKSNENLPEIDKSANDKTAPQASNSLDVVSSMKPVVQTVTDNATAATKKEMEPCNKRNMATSNVNKTGNAVYNKNDENRDGFKLVSYNRRNKKKVPSVIGTNNDETLIKAAPKKAWFFISRLRQDTTTEDLQKYLSHKFNGENLICTKINTTDTSSSFRVGANYNLKEQIEDPKFWPSGVQVRKYIFQRKALPQRIK